MPIILCLMMNGYIRLTSGLINDVIELTAKNQKIQEEQLQIFQNLEESIIILTKFKPYFANDRFLNLFASQFENISEESKSL